MISGTRYRLTVEINRQARLSQEIARAQAEISGGKKIIQPSDDPLGAARAAQIGRAQGDEKTWMRNLGVAESLAARADNTLKAIASGLDRANELMVSARTDTLSDDNRAVIASELRAIAEEVAALMDTRDERGEPLFRVNGALEVPVSAGITIAPVATRDMVFQNIDTAGGPAALVDILNGAADAVAETDPALRNAATATALDEINVAQGHIAGARADQGVRAARVDALIERLEDSKITLAEQRVKVEGTDVADAIARIQAHDLSLKASQAIYAEVNRTGLFDLIR